MTHQHELLPLEELGTTNSGGALRTSDVDVDIDVASEPLATPAALQQQVTPTYGPDRASDEALERWKLIQGNFVDDPRGAVAEARTLVDDLVQGIVRDFTQHRESLDRQWASEQTTSTEQLRVCLQHYRAFFTRILPALPATLQGETHVNR